MTQQDSTRAPVIAVTGVTGKTGRAVADRALDEGWTVHGLSRQRPPVGEWRPMDWDDAATWPRAFAGADAAYVLIPFNHPGAAENTPAVLEAAAAAGVARIVLLSSFDATDAAEDDPLRRSEDTLRGLPVSSTTLRPTWFLDNFTQGSFGAMMREGSLRLPARDGRIPFVAVGDIASVAIEALRENGPTGVLPLTGPESVTHAEVCAAFSRAWGRTITFTTVDEEEFVRLMAGRGFDRSYSDFLIDALARVDSGQTVVPVSDVIESVTGAPPLSVSRFATRHADLPGD